MLVIIPVFLGLVDIRLQEKKKPAPEQGEQDGLKRRVQHAGASEILHPPGD
jgi:hypothetical protein